MKKYKITICIIPLTLAYITTATAASLNFNPDSVSVTTSLGGLWGQADEYIYNSDTGHKNSELNWKINNAPIIKGDISWDALPNLTLNARGWITLKSSHSGMDDYDWMRPKKAMWTNWSHSNTNLNYANEFDINLKGWLLKKPNYNFGGVLGYQQTRFSWTAIGMYGLYESSLSKDKYYLVHDNGPVIGYKQKFSAPYIGLIGQYRYHDLEFNGLLKFSPWVQAKDNDEHYLRRFTFRDKTNKSRYYSATLNVGYYIHPNTKIFTELSWNKFTQGKGDTESFDRKTEEYFYDGGNSAGIANANYNITAGIQYRF
ncbi:omptin family outer membrane protease [Xenorhabdus anantnagensis]|uniref:Omptin family outer membrane protease n=1 Tax=Xenorhabdus anantnagensis TaxID=3025875 RepID=A0ABT5LRL1_9GAMM|nr:omptin family outer membrane protease [Xenorhabdus anantnagensis]MDC9597041.1 omptin family outer membrane protease [Xenorhabdus anantnagensis]